MKNIKKLFVAVLTFVLSLCVINTALAATTKGSIKVTETTKGKVYDIYKIFDLTYSGSGSNLKVAYTIDSSWNDFFKVGGAGAKYIVDTDSTGKLNAITIGSTTKYINITDKNVAEFAQAALAYLGKTSTITADASKTATGTSLEFTNLDYGYYLVYPKGATEIKSQNASIASLTSTTPKAEVVVKATYPTIDKTVSENSIQVGNYAKFTITGKIPDTTGFVTYTYKIHDSWTSGLEYNASNFNFKLVIGTTQLKNTDYTLTLTKDTNNNVTGFNVTINPKNYTVGSKVEIVYNLRVTADAIMSTTTKNSAYLEYSNDPKTNGTGLTPPEEEYVYSSRIEVLKVDGASCTTDKETGKKTCTTPLAGAKFVLMNSTKTAYYSIDEIEMGDNGTIVKNIKWVSKLSDAAVFTTDSNGIIDYIGLKSFAGLKDGEYNLVETEAPKGFNLLAKPIKVTVAGDKDANNKPIPVVQSLTVENNSGLKLPSTGGVGTTMFIVIGSLLAVISAVILVTNKRMSKEY